MARCTVRDWVSDSLEPRAPIRTTGCEDTGRRLPQKTLMAPRLQAGRIGRNFSMSALTVLGLETSCDETAAAVVRLENGRAVVLSSIIRGQAEAHAPFGGVAPEAGGVGQHLFAGANAAHHFYLAALQRPQPDLAQTRLALVEQQLLD